MISNAILKDPKTIWLSGSKIHPILGYTGNKADSIKATLFEFTEEELHCADKYELIIIKAMKQFLNLEI